MQLHVFFFFYMCVCDKVGRWQEGDDIKMIVGSIHACMYMHHTSGSFICQGTCVYICVCDKVGRWQEGVALMM